MSEYLEGGCTCGTIRYQLTASPLFVHCCHCRWCQRETGSAFVINVLIETSHVRLEKGEPVLKRLPSPSGRGQSFARCPDCGLTLWSHYGGMGNKVSFIRGGTLDEPHLAPPTIHIFTSSKLPWLELKEDIPIMPNFYRRAQYWPKESLERYKALKDKPAS
ncbi:MAG: GFA family protein [Pseudomonadota bacterium]